MKRKYTAVFSANRSRIISVHAENQDDANAKIEEQLRRPGRMDAFVRWVEDGRLVLREDGEYFGDANPESNEFEKQLVAKLDALAALDLNHSEMTALLDLINACPANSDSRLATAAALECLLWPDDSNEPPVP